MHKELMRLAINLLDNPNGIAIETYDYLKATLRAEQTNDAKELLENVTVTNGVAFLNEDWVEANFVRFE